MLRQNKILGNMLGADIDFIVKGIDSKARSVVASRRDAMLKKRQTFYLDTDAATGMYRIYEDRIVQARVIAVADKVIRVEVFGVECSIMARDLSWDWITRHPFIYDISERGKIIIVTGGIDVIIYGNKSHGTLSKLFPLWYNNAKSDESSNIKGLRV